VLEKERVSAPENLEVEADGFLEEDELPEFKPSLTGDGAHSADQCWSRDIEQLDELMGRYLPIALSARQDFDRALRAAHVVLELIETQTTLLETYLGGTK
jgi:hypothetical protein